MLTSVMQKGILMSEFARVSAEFDAVVDALILMVDNYPNDADLGAEMRILFNKIRKDGND